MESWETDLENQISNHGAKVKSKPGGRKKLLLSVAVLSLLLSFVFSYKTRSDFRSWVQSHFRMQEALGSKKPGAVEPEPKKKDEPDRDETLSKLIKKMNIIGIVMNENFSILQKRDPGSNFIFINHDWTLSRMPENIEIKKEDLGFVEDNVRQ
jgi:hypothetical protein